MALFNSIADNCASKKIPSMKPIFTPFYLLHGRFHLTDVNTFSHNVWKICKPLHNRQITWNEYERSNFIQCDTREDFSFLKCKPAKKVHF